MEFLIYLDVCCLNRPFDDQTQERIFLEAEAIRLILARCQSGEWQLLGSEVMDVSWNRHQTTDDRMLRLGAKYSAMLQVRVENPLRWVSEIINARRD